jgi:tetratricopeptide (TPR) repeat protein
MFWGLGMILTGSLSAAVTAWVVAASITSSPAIDSFEVCRDARGPVAVEACDRVRRAERARLGDLADVYIDRGQTHYGKREWDAAIASFDQAIRLDPGVALAFGNRANAWLMKKELARALLDYDRALAIDPNYTAAYAGRALIHEAKGDFDLARADFQRALAVPPKYQDGVWAHSIAKTHIGKLNESTSHASK